MNNQPLKINFLIPFKSLTGGIKVVFEYANHLKNLGHSVTVTYPLIPYYFGEKAFNLKDRWWQFRGTLANIILGNKVKWFDLKVDLKRVPWITKHFTSQSDIVIATAWPTASSLAKLPEQAGRKFYFVQGYEIWDGNKLRVEKSYELPLRKIFVSPWLKNLINREVKEYEGDAFIQGVNFNEFYNENKMFNNPRRLLIMYSKLEIKGFSDILTAIKLVREKNLQIKLVAFGAKRSAELPNDIEFHERPFGEQLRKLYCSCDIFVSASWMEGCQLPPMEAMACKCAVVATNVGGIPDYTIPDETALLVEPRDVKALAEKIIYLLDNPEELKRISYAGYNHIKNFTWEKAARKMETIFKEAVANPS